MSAQPAEIYWEGLRPNVNKLFLPQAVSEQIVGIEAATNEAKMEEDKEEVVKEEPNIELVGLSDDIRRDSGTKVVDSVSFWHLILLQL